MAETDQPAEPDRGSASVSGGHGGAAGSPADEIEMDICFAKRTIDADVRCAVSAAAASNETQSCAVDETPKTRRVFRIAHRDVMMHRRLACREPVTRTLRNALAAMDEDQSARSRTVQRQRKLFKRAERNGSPDRII